MAVYVRLLGPPAIRHEGVWLEPPPGKVSALLFHLAYRRVWVAREELAYLFWPDVPEANARANLRKLLARARGLAWTVDLEAERARLRWPVDSDAREMADAVEVGRIAEIVQLYGGDLLQGFRLADAGEFERWLDIERDQLATTWRHAVLGSASELEEAGRHAEAAATLEALLRADPLDEEVLERQLRLLNLAGRRREALERFGAFSRRLADEFGVDPAPSTLGLIDDIRRDEPPAGARTSSTEVQSRPVVAPGSILPALPTPFVGREMEMRRLTEQLADPACRLLTLIAPGGMGKTRLALAVAADQLERERFRDGVVFVPLSAIAASGQLAYAVAERLGYAFVGQDDPREQLLRYLAGKEMLLVLDNIEQLTESASFITAMLEGAPGLTVLATSRERLRLRSEWLVDLAGLAFPEDAVADNAGPGDAGPGDAGPGEAESFDAVRLFVQSARRARSDFALDEHNLDAVVSICRLVAGMPLALELAASWLRVLDPNEIAAEIARGIDLLSTSTQDTPERHRSIRAVFDASWAFLSAEERKVARNLAVFRGGFLRDAAVAVAGATLPVLAGLVDRSFLTKMPSGRYRRHPLVYQYTREKLRQADDVAELEERHAHYYLRALQGWGQTLYGGTQREVLGLIEAELENIRIAWRWASSRRREADLRPGCHPLKIYFVQSNRFREGVEFFNEAEEGLSERNAEQWGLLGEVLLAQSNFDYRLCDYPRAMEVARRGTAILRLAADERGTALGLNLMGIISIQTGAYGEAVDYLLQALALARRLNEPRVVANYINNLGLVEMELGQYPQAETHLREAVEVNDAVGNHLSRARNLSNLGYVFMRQERFEEAEAFFHEALALAREMGFRQPLPHSLNGLAGLAVAASDYVQAQTLAREALSLAREGGEKSLEVEILAQLARAAAGRGDEATAVAFGQQALEIGWAVGALTPSLPVLVDLAALFAEQGEVGFAVRTLRLVRDHPSTNQAARSRALDLLARWREAKAAEGEDDVPGVGAAADLEGVVREALSWRAGRGDATGGRR